IVGIRLRNLGRLTKNNYYDDKSWLALALDRERRLNKRAKREYLRVLEGNIAAGQDDIQGVLPWRVGEHFFNVPTNGPAAIMLARN
ncbi:glycoside hydrolase family 76, partial [Corynebacterium diphtheriae bv. mitis]|nr:glycoside hydrolase family 76 [Corynebacterium diphtheriae bv. mitis]